VPVPAQSRLTVGAPRRNRRRSAPLRARLPRLRDVPRGLVIACGRAMRRAAPALLVLTAAGAVGAGAFAGYRFITTSPRFAIDSIEIQGAHATSADDLRARLPIALGDNVFLADLDAVEARLEAEPWIADAAVRRRLPRTIEIDIVEREAAAVVELDGLYLADADGRPFKRARLDLGEGQGLPVVTGIARDTLRDDPTAAADRVKRALGTLAAWTADGAARPTIGEVRVDERFAVTLFTYDDAIAVRLGEADGEPLRDRLGRFDAAWAALSPDERVRTRAIHLDHDTRPDHITVAFERTEKQTELQ
jgi:cell division protein FtsQ